MRPNESRNNQWIDVPIRESVTRKLEPEEKKEAFVIAQQIKKLALQKLSNKSSAYCLLIPESSSKKHLNILQAHGGWGFEQAEFIIDVHENLRGSKERGFETDRIASYLFFADIVVNRPSLWIMQRNSNPSIAHRYFGREKLPGDDPYEVGEEELVALLEVLKTSQNVAKDQVVVSSIK